jgi:hypothetical protein
MKPLVKTVGIGILSLGALWLPLALSFNPATTGTAGPAQHHDSDGAVFEDAENMVRDGRHTFRLDTFGDEEFWGDTLRLNEAIAGAANGGVGPGLSPIEALAAGLKVDQEALSPGYLNQIAHGHVDLHDPAVTLELLRRNAVVGVTGFFDPHDHLASIGIQCAMCHSTVDDAFAPGIGRRLDGWANRDLDVGAIVNLSPDLSSVAGLLGVSEPTVRHVLSSWGPGKFDAALLLDGKAFSPSGTSGATLIPPAFGLAGVNLHTWTGWGSVTHWNAFVANIEMHGKGTFFDSRLDDATQFPVAAANALGHIHHAPDLVTSKLPALHFYQLALLAPPPPEGSFDPQAAERGHGVFVGQARCATCHVEPLFTEPGWNLHRPEEIGIDDFQASRSPDRRYRTTPLKGLWTHVRGGFYHDGRFATLGQVVDHYDQFFALGLSTQSKSDLVQYLLSL